jgi:hypothetical protein
MKKLSLAILCVCFALLPAFAADIEVTAPTAGASWKIGTTQTVQWTFTGLPAATKVHILLWQGGANLGKIAKQYSIGSNGQGSFSWNVGDVLDVPPAVAGSGYFIKVRTVDDACAGISGTFNLTSASSGPVMQNPDPSQLQSSYELGHKVKPELPGVTGAQVKMIQVSEPQAGAVLDPTGAAKLAWKFINIPESDVSITLLRDGQPDELLFGSITAGHEFTWDLSSMQPDPGTCRIAVVTLDKKYHGKSGAFSIKELGQIEPVFPFQDLPIYDDTSLDVQWKRVGNIQKVDLILKKTDASWQKVLATGVDAKLEKKNVTFNFDQYGQFVIEFNYTVDGETVNVSSGVFTINSHQ